jgi:hypothetical protein
MKFFFAVLIAAMAVYCRADNLCQDFLFQKDLTATLSGFEFLRGENGLVQDTLWIEENKDHRLSLSVLNSKTSPTNIALDLLIQAQRKRKPVLKRVLETLKALPYHKKSGLFFSWYSTKKIKAEQKAVSSVDNLHLALALWTVKENFPKEDFGKTAAELFARMNFSVFYHPDSGLIGGNLRPEKNGRWVLEEYNFSHFGSEARLLYSLGWALKLFKDFPQEDAFIEKALAALEIETSPSEHGELLKLWDGALFQLYFPKIFINEEIYSPKMKAYYKNTARLILEEGKTRNLILPAAHSPARASYEVYQDKSGLRALVSRYNQDLNDPRYASQWDELFTPYAFFMASTSWKTHFLKAHENARALRVDGQTLFRSGLGWMDGLLLQDHQMKIIPAQLAVNQGMIALSLFQLHHPKGWSLSSETLYNDKEVRARLQSFYRLFEAKIKKGG